MTQFTPGLIIEILLIGLLGLTVGYCMVLNKRLARLRSSQQDLRQIITELSTATQTAERAIRGLKVTTEEADLRLTDKLHKAQLLARELSVLTGGTTEPAAPRAQAEARPIAPADNKARPASAPKASSDAPTDPEQWRRIAMSRLGKAG